MTAPRRWKESPRAPVGVRELFSSAKPRRPLDDGSYRRGAESVAKLGVAPAVVALTTIWAKLAAAGAVGLLAAGALVAVELHPSRESRDRESPSVARARDAIPEPASSSAPTDIAAHPREPSPSAALPTNPKLAPSAPSALAVALAPLTPAAPTTIPAPAIPASALPTALSTAALPEVAPPPRPSTLSAELSFLEDARVHLARDPETSLRHLAAHRARYPRGVLAAERDLVELDALRRAGRVEDARIRARAWLERDPAGLHAARVRAILASLEAPGPR